MLVAVFVGVEVAVGGTGVLVSVFVGVEVTVGGTEVLVAVLVGVKVAVGGTGVLVAVLAGVLVAVAVAVLPLPKDTVNSGTNAPSRVDIVRPSELVVAKSKVYTPSPTIAVVTSISNQASGPTVPIKSSNSPLISCGRFSQVMVASSHVFSAR